MRGLSNDDVAFYTAIATSIPIFFVAYAVSMTSLARNLGSTYDEFIKDCVLALNNFVTKRKAALIRALPALLSGTSSLLVLVVLVVVTVVLPGLGEYAALHALAVGSASSLTRALSEIGILAAGLVVVAPLTVILLRSLSLVPAVSYLLRVRKDMRDVHSIYSRWKDGDFTSTDWMAPGIALRFVRRGNETPTDWTGPANLTNLALAAWGADTYPEWHGAVLLGVGRLIVFDRVRNEDGASVFTLSENNVTKVVVYQDRDQAIGENRKAKLKSGGHAALTA